MIAEQESLRRSGEAHLASVLDRAGLEGVPAYSLVSGSMKDEDQVERVIDASGAVGVVVIRPLGKEQEIASTPTYGAPHYGGFWGRGYCGYGWGGSEIRTDTYVIIETLIYDRRQNKLVWAGQSKRMNPSDVEQFIDELAAAVSKELQAAGQVAKKWCRRVMRGRRRRAPASPHRPQAPRVTPAATAVAASWTPDAAGSSVARGRHW